MKKFVYARGTASALAVVTDHHRKSIVCCVSTAIGSLHGALEACSGFEAWFRSSVEGFVYGHSNSLSPRVAMLRLAGSLID